MPAPTWLLRSFISVKAPNAFLCTLGDPLRKCLFESFRLCDIMDGGGVSFSLDMEERQNKNGGCD